MRGVKYKKIIPVHRDIRRTLTEVFSGEFTAKQLKVLHINQDGILGNHYHPYRQFFYFLKGKAKYIFINIATKETEEINAEEGDFIIIDSNIAHAAQQFAGNIMIEGNEQPYTSPEIDDLKYKIL